MVAAAVGPLFSADAPAAPPPSIRVAVEWVDPSAFPDVDVYFRVLDTVPSAAFHAIRPEDVTLHEALEPGGSFDPVPMRTNNFDAPDIRPLAVSLAVDRSSSVERILDKLKEGTMRFLGGMSDNGPLADDAASLVFFCGYPNLKKVHHLPMTTQRDQLVQYTSDYMTRACGGTPLHKSWNLAIRDAALDQYPARGVLMLTDGKNYPRNSGPTVDSIIPAAVSNGLPVFNFAFVKISKAGKVARNSVYRPDMTRMADATGGAYFEPIPPWPMLPGLPDEPDDPASADALPDDQAIAYGQQALGLVKNMLLEDPEAQYSQFQEIINRFIEPDCATQADFLSLDLSNPSLLQDAASTLSYQDLDAVDTALELVSRTNVTEEDLKTFYCDQVENMFTKVRTSLKTLYRATFTSAAPQCRGEPRDVKVSVAYQTHINFAPLNLAGSSIGRYITPVVAEEDKEVSLVSSLNAASPVYGQLFGAQAAPRAGTWQGQTALEYAVDLVARDSDSRPVSLALRKADGSVELATSGPVTELDAADKQAVTTYLTHLQLQAEPDPSAGQLTVKLTGKLPTCLVQRDRPFERPLENPRALGFRKLLAYRIRPTAARVYSYNMEVPTEEGQPGQVVPSTGRVSMDLPTLVAYVADTTAPSLALYLTSTRNSVVNRADALEVPTDSAERPRVFKLALGGLNWNAPAEVAVSGAGTGVTSVGAAIEGHFYIEEDVRINVAVLAQDNFDHSRDAGHLAANGPQLAAHNVFADTDPNTPEGRNGQPPFLSRGTPAEAGAEVPVSLTLDENGTRSAIQDSVIFRAPNVPAGEPVAIEARAVDRTGNVTLLRVSVHVLPLGIELKRIQFEQQKGN
jgi:hypothetical protein